MSFLSGLGDVFHAIGHFVSGGDSNANAGTSFDDQQDQQRRQQQQSQAPQQSSQPQQSGDNNNPVTNNTINLSPLEKAGNNNSNNPSSLTNYSQAPHPQASSLAKAPANNDNSGMAGAQDNTPNNNNGGFWHEVTHNPVTNVVGGVAKAAAAPFEYLGKTDIIDPARELVDQATGNQAAYNQEMANNNVDLGLSQRNPDGSITGNSLKGGLEKWAGNSAGALLTVAAPGADNLIKDGVGNIISDTALPGVVKSQLPKFVAGGTIGGAFNDANTVANGDTNPGDLAKSFGQGFAVGGTAGVALPAIASGLKKVTGFGADNASADASQVAPGIKSANPDLNNGGGVIEPTDNTPAYQRGTPTTVGEAQGQHAIGVNNIPDEAFNADARIAQQDTPSPLDVPTYMRNSAESQLEDANNRIAQADQQMSLINNAPNAQTRAFNGKQAIADAYKDSPTKGQATAALVKARQGAVGDPTDALPQIMAERAKAVSDANAAKAAIAARDQLSLGGVIKDELTNPATIAEGSTVAGTVAKEAVDEAHIAAEQKAQAAAQAAQNQPLPTVEFNEGPSVSPGTLPPDTVNASPTAAVTRGGTAPAVVNAAPTALIKPLDQAGSVPGAVAERPAPTVQTPEQAAAAQQPIQVAEPQTPATVDTTPQTQAPTPAEQVQAAAAQEASQAPTPLIAQAADDAERLKNARFQQTVVDASKNPAMKSALEEAAQNKDTAPLAQLNEQAISNVQNMSLPELVQHYGQDFAEGEKGPIDNPQQLYEHLQALRQLEQLPTDAAAQDAAANALRAINDYANRSGVGTRAMQLAYTDMPTSMKVAYLTKLVQKAGGDFGPGNPDFEHLMAAADLQTKFAQTAQDAENAAHDYSTSANQADPNFNDNMKALLARDQEAQGVLYDQNRNVLNILERNLPKSDLGTRVAQQARTSMLSSIGGRGFAMTSTLANGAQWLADNTLSSLFGKVINRVNGDNAVRASFARPGTLVKGAAQGFKGLSRDTFGSSPVESVDKALKGNYDNEYSHDNTRYGFIGNHVTAPLRKGVRFMVGTHLAVTKGIGDATLEQSARQAAQDAGIPRENMQGFVDYYKAHPPQQMADEAKQAWMGVNNLHKNAVSDTLSKAASAIENLGGKGGDGKAAATASFVAKQIRTVFVPFSHYMGGFVDKALTDRNMFYNIGRAATARSPQEFSDQLAKLTTNVGVAVGAGYGLAQAGVITTKDQNGKGYDGLYFHVGNHYIPVAIAGQAAMPIIMGATYHDAMHDGSKGGSWPQKAVTAAMQSGDDILKATGVAGTFGGNSSVNQLLAGNGEAAIPKITGAAVQQHVPAVTGDVNALLNQTSLNPTHEAANTKVTNLNPTTGLQNTDQVATQIAKTENEIPGMSQLALPRATGQAAPTELDRMLHAGESSPTQLKDAQLAKAQLSQDQQDYKNDVPIYKPGKNDVPKGYNFDNTLNSDIQTNKFDKAVAGLQNQLKDMTTPGPEHNPPDKIQAVRDRISQFQLAQKNKWSYDDMKQYNSTSVSAWRDMGNPDKSTYDPTTYQKLWAMDATLAKSGVAGTLGIGDGNSVKASSTQKYNLSTGKSGSGSSKASSLVKSNTIGSVSAIPNEDFTTNLKATPISARIPQIALTKPDTLIKAHKISVASPRA